MTFEWVITPEQAFTQSFDEWVKWLQMSLRALCDRYAIEIEIWMKTNAPWMDRTGNARQSLYAAVEEMVGEVSLLFDYGVFYGVFLEFKNAGKYAVIAPALDYFWPRIVADIQALLS